MVIMQPVFYELPDSFGKTDLLARGNSLHLVERLVVEGDDDAFGGVVLPKAYAPGRFFILAAVDHVSTYFRMTAAQFSWVGHRSTEVWASL